MQNLNTHVTHQKIQTAPPQDRAPVLRPWIMNISAIEAQKGLFPYNADVMIRIHDPGKVVLPLSRYANETHNFFFLDAGPEDTQPNKPLAGANEFLMQPEQAKQIAKILVDAFNKDQNVVVHCVAGICRSGAVVEAGVQLGFSDTANFRAPNMHCLHLLLDSLNLRITNATSCFQ